MSKVTPKIFLEWFVNDFYKILGIAAIFGVITVIYSLSLPNKYSAKAVVVSNMSESKSMGALSKLGGLASLAGVNISGGGALSPEVLFETISSNSFLASFIKAYRLQTIIMASEGFNPSTNEFIFDEKIYNKASEKWVRDYKFPQTQEPSDIELVEKFKESFSTNYARKTKLISIYFKSYSPEFAKQLVENIIKHFNEYIRKNDLNDSQQSINYLEQELASAKYKEVKIALQQIMEEQYKTLALAKTRDEYAFRVIEAPLLAAKKSEPKRAIICIAGTLGGTVFFILVWWTIRIFRTA